MLVKPAEMLIKPAALIADFDQFGSESLAPSLFPF